MGFQLLTSRILGLALFIVRALSATFLRWQAVTSHTCKECNAWSICATSCPMLNSRGRFVPNRERDTYGGWDGDRRLCHKLDSGPCSGCRWRDFLRPNRWFL